MNPKADLIHKLEWDPLFIASREALKMIREGFISRSDVAKELKKFSRDLKVGSAAILPSVERYKLNLINQAHENVQHGIFSMQEIEYLQTYYTRDDMTIFATPRVLNKDTEMAWAIISPILDRLDRWKKIAELFEADVLSEKELNTAREALIGGETLDQKVEKSVFFLDRMKYAKNRGIIDEKGYQKALKLIPLMRKEFLGEVESPVMNLNSREMLEGIEQGDQASVKENVVSEENNQIDGFQEQSDPIFEWKRLVFILIDAWQATLNSSLKELFGFLQSCTDVELLQNVHQFLVHLNREYVTDDRENEQKRTIYLKKIEQYSSSLTPKKAIG